MEIKKHIHTDLYDKVHGFQDIDCGPLDGDSQPQGISDLQGVKFVVFPGLCW